MLNPEAMEQPLKTTHNLILGSGSPRRKELLEQMGLVFRLQPLSVKEVFPEYLEGAAITDYLAKLKADAYFNYLKHDELLITADTVVWHEGRLLGKPSGLEEAGKMLQALSDDWHEVITSVCCTTQEDQRVLHETTLVKFRRLREEEIAYYTNHFIPFDKAGGYGIQEWIGLVGISEISGSYTNVVGLPTASLYELLRAMAC